MLPFQTQNVELVLVQGESREAGLKAAIVAMMGLLAEEYKTQAKAAIDRNDFGLAHERLADAEAVLENAREFEPEPETGLGYSEPSYRY